MSNRNGPAKGKAESIPAPVVSEDCIAEGNANPVGAQDTARVERWRRSGADRSAGGAPLGSHNAMKHGIYADRFLSADERVIFDSITAQLQEDFVFNKSSDFMQVELVAVYFLKLGRAQEAEDWDGAERLDRMIRCHLKDLKATKISREGDEPRGLQTTPAEWATALLERVTESERVAKLESDKLEADKLEADKREAQKAEAEIADAGQTEAVQGDR